MLDKAGFHATGLWFYHTNDIITNIKYNEMLTHLYVIDSIFALTDKEIPFIENHIPNFSLESLTSGIYVYFI